MICNHPDRTRSQPARRRTRAEATALTRLDVPSRASILRSFSSLPGDARPAEPEIPLFLPNVPTPLSLLLLAYLLLLAPSPPARPAASGRTPPAQPCSGLFVRLRPSGQFSAIVVPGVCGCNPSLQGPDTEPARPHPLRAGGGSPRRTAHVLKPGVCSSRAHELLQPGFHQGPRDHPVFVGYCDGDRSARHAVPAREHGVREAPRPLVAD